MQIDRERNGGSKSERETMASDCEATIASASSGERPWYPRLDVGYRGETDSMAAVGSLCPTHSTIAPFFWNDELLVNVGLCFLPAIAPNAGLYSLQTTPLPFSWHFACLKLITHLSLFLLSSAVSIFCILTVIFLCILQNAGRSTTP
jgi:hypothetical protein